MEKLADKKTKALLLVAHPDDEVIFCGGTMLLYPDCQWTVISMTDDGRLEAFNNSIASLKKLGVNIVLSKTLGQKNVPIKSIVDDLMDEALLWEKVIREQNFYPDIVITHNEQGEYGHGAHKLLSFVAGKIYTNIWKFVLPPAGNAHSAKKFEVALSKDVLAKKMDLFNKSYPSEFYIWKALHSLMEYEFYTGPEVFTPKEVVTNMQKKRILVILPDRFIKSSGGIGANSGPVFEKLAPEYDFYVAGYPLGDTFVPPFVKSYQEVFNPFTEVRSGALGVMTSQVRYFSAAIRFPNPDLVLAFDWSIYLAAVETSKYFGVPLVARMSMSPILLGEQGYTFGLDLADPLSKALHNSFCEMEIRGLKSADRIIQVSKKYSELYEHVAPSFARKTRLVVDGIDLEKWESLEIKDFKLPGSSRKKVVFLGRLSEVKGILPLCLARVPKGIDLIFIGPKETADRACLKAIEDKVESEDNVYYLGALYGNEKMRALISADAIIVPSYHESFGGVALEGLAARSIVMSSRAGGLSDFLDNNNSIYCGKTREEIEQAYQVFLGQREEQKIVMCEAGLEVCRRLTINSTARQLQDVFNELL